MTDFASILSKPADTVEAPKPLPVGTYLGVVKGVPEFGTMGKNDTPTATFQLSVLQPQDDVDREALSAYGDYGGRSQRHRFFLTEDALFRLKQFLVDHLGLEEQGKTLGQLCSEAPGHQVYFTIGHRPNQDGTQIYAEIKSTARV